MSFLTFQISICRPCRQHALGWAGDKGGRGNARALTFFSASLALGSLMVKGWGGKKPDHKKVNLAKLLLKKT